MTEKKDELIQTAGYLYFIIRSEDIQTSEDATIFFKVGMTKDPRSRISNYITHHLGEAPPIYYKIWKVRNEKSEETLALEHFEQRRIVKAGSTNPSEVIRATKAEIDAYTPQDPQRRAIAPHTMLPEENYVIKYDIGQRFEEHWEELSEIQNRVISDIVGFLRIKEAGARKLRAPCGTGKTHMTCEAIKLIATEDSTLKVCILCPTRLIAEQWRGNFYRLGIEAPILIKSDIQTREGEQREDQTGHRFRIITYASCPALRADPQWTYVFDEAHHTCGAIDGENGITKRLVNETMIAGCRRLFLTFTPKSFLLEGLNSMNDSELYGTDITFPTMENLVSSGLMPDYRLTLTYRNHEETLKAVIEEVKSAKKIIVCLQSVEAIETMNNYLKKIDSSAGDPSKNVYIAHGGMQNEQIAESINGFATQLERSWLLTCLVLLEGADIPVADTVVLLAPWKTETRLIQLLLRPGRWYPKKPTFNIVAPTDENNLIETNLRVAGFNILPNKVRHLRVSSQETSGNPRTPLGIVRDSGHIWAVSYTDKNSLEGGLTPAATDFDNAIGNSQITAVQLGLDKAKAGDMVILRGPSHVAFASVSAVRIALESTKDGKGKKRTVMDVNYLPIRGGNGSILLSVKQYRDCINEMWNGREDKDWICNPRFTGNFKYDTERRALITKMIDNGMIET
jgi:hypothetical protein